MAGIWTYVNNGEVSKNWFGKMTEKSVVWGGGGDVQGVGTAGRSGQDGGDLT